MFWHDYRHSNQVQQTHYIYQQQPQNTFVEIQRVQEQPQNVQQQVQNAPQPTQRTEQQPHYVQRQVQNTSQSTQTVPQQPQKLQQSPQNIRQQPQKTQSISVQTEYVAQPKSKPSSSSNRRTIYVQQQPNTVYYVVQEQPSTTTYYVQQQPQPQYVVKNHRHDRHKGLGETALLLGAGLVLGGIIF